MSRAQSQPRERMTNGRMMVCRIPITWWIARVANWSLRFFTNFRDEIKVVVRSIDIARMDNTDRVRQVALSTIAELLSLMRPPSCD